MVTACKIYLRLELIVLSRHGVLARIMFYSHFCLPFFVAPVCLMLDAHVKDQLIENFGKHRAERRGWVIMAV